MSLFWATVKGALEFSPTHTFSIQADAVYILYDPIEDGIGDVGSPIMLAVRIASRAYRFSRQFVELFDEDQPPSRVPGRQAAQGNVISRRTG